MIYVSSAVRAMNQEAVDAWALGRQVYTQVSSSAIGGALDLNQNPPSFILQEKLSVQSFSTKAPAKGWRLLFAVDIHSIPLNLIQVCAI